ncbi:MAG: hypothetical protein KDC44_00700 [Phaeodactylibacter sp.]|nr:hypothetical protein [Phaeodactylibacter sp.]
MLQNWLQEVPASVLRLAKTQPNCFGNQIDIYQQEIPDLKGVQVALIGLQAREANAVREHLYAMSFPFGTLKIADLGNARRSSASFMVQVLRELHESKIIPIIIAKTPDLIRLQYQALLTLRSAISMAVVDDHVPIHPEPVPGESAQYLDNLVDHEIAPPFFLQLLAGQTHFIDPERIARFSPQRFGMLRLGSLRSDLTTAEPLIRDADLVGFHLRAMKQIEAPAVEGKSPSGLFSEDAAQLARYAGMSDKLLSFGLYGFQANMEGKVQTAQLISQLIWYFLDGLAHRKQDFPVSTDGLVEYIVDFKGDDQQLVFWKSMKSGRWWIQIPAETNDELKRHRLVPCAYQDYLQACEGDLPDRLFNALSRFEA